MYAWHRKALSWRDVRGEAEARGAWVQPPAWAGDVLSSDPKKEQREDAFINGLPQKDFAAFAALYKCESLSFCSGVLPIRGF